MRKIALCLGLLGTLIPAVALAPTSASGSGQLNCYPPRGPAAGSLPYGKRVVVATSQCKSWKMWLIGGRGSGPGHIPRLCGCEG